MTLKPEEIFFRPGSMEKHSVKRYAERIDKAEREHAPDQYAEDCPGCPACGSYDAGPVGVEGIQFSLYSRGYPEQLIRYEV